MSMYNLYIADTYIVITYFIKGKLHQYRIEVSNVMTNNK